MRLPGRDLLSEALDGLKRGWSYTPLRGKIPVLLTWQKNPPSTEAQIRAWVGDGQNLGVRTGAVSGVFIVDVERGGSPPEGMPDSAPIVETGNGGRHYYLRHRSGLGNTSRRLPLTDTRGEGGQALAPGSIHPDTGQPYRWLVPPSGELPPVPEAWLTGWLGERTLHVPPERPQRGYGEVALTREAEAVTTAPEGTRNDTLNRAAFSIGQLVAGGEIDATVATETLAQAATTAGLPAREAQTTIRSGMSAGARTPRHAPARVPDHLPAQLPTEKPTILVPGGHTTDHGERFEIGAHEFAANVLAALPPEHIWRRGGVAGELIGQPGRKAFMPYERQRARLAIDKYTRLTRWVSKKEEGETVHYESFASCTADYGEILIAAATDHPDIRDLEFISPYPVCIPPDFRPAQTGYNPGGVYYDGTSTLTPLTDPNEITAVLNDLVTDFPFATDADRENFFGLLLTPLLRPCISGNVPMHLVGSPLERSGKTKLCEEVFGGVILGEPLSALQFTGKDEEWDKRVLPLLLSGQTLAHLDNLGEFVDSPVLCSMLTATKYQSRMLGVSKMVTVPNRLTIVASGNNVRSTGEIAKRIIPINLTPKEERPDTRTNFRHPELREYIRDVRSRVLEALFGAIQLWRGEGCPMSDRPVGGFEDWSKIVGGILHTLGFRSWLANRDEWVISTDDFSSDLSRLVERWAVEYGSMAQPVSTLLALAESLEIFPDALNGKTPRATQTMFGRRVLRRAAGRVVGEWKIVSLSSGNNRRYALVAV